MLSQLFESNLPSNQDSEQTIDIHLPSYPAHQGSKLPWVGTRAEPTVPVLSYTYDFPEDIPIGTPSLTYSTSFQDTESFLASPPPNIHDTLFQPDTPKHSTYREAQHLSNDINHNLLPTERGRYRDMFSPRNSLSYLTSPQGKESCQQRNEEIVQTYLELGRDFERIVRQWPREYAGKFTIRASFQLESQCDAWEERLRETIEETNDYFRMESLYIETLHMALTVCADCLAHNIPKDSIYTTIQELRTVLTPAVMYDDWCRDAPDLQPDYGFDKPSPQHSPDNFVFAHDSTRSRTSDGNHASHPALSEYHQLRDEGPMISPQTAWSTSDVDEECVFDMDD